LRSPAEFLNTFHEFESPCDATPCKASEDLVAVFFGTRTRRARSLSIVEFVELAVRRENVEHEYSVVRASLDHFSEGTQVSVPIDGIHGLFGPRVFLENVLFQWRRCRLVSQVLGVLTRDCAMRAEEMCMGCSGHQGKGSGGAVCILICAYFRVCVNIELSHLI
jgi:hypothetical protein